MIDFGGAVNASNLRLQRALIPSRRARSREVLTQDVPVYQGELWTALQRQASSIHEISYRACYKPQLPLQRARHHGCGSRTAGPQRDRQ